MDSSEEKFFEQIAGVAPDGSAPHEYEAEFAKVRTAPELRVAPRSVKEKNDDGPEGQLTIDVYQTPTDIVVESAIAGVDSDDLDIYVSQDSITIRGARNHAHDVPDEDYIYQECYWGRFSRSIILPQEVDPDRAEVNLAKGILTVRLPKLVRTKGKKLKVSQS